MCSLHAVRFRCRLSFFSPKHKITEHSLNTKINSGEFVYSPGHVLHRNHCTCCTLFITDAEHFLNTWARELQYNTQLDQLGVLSPAPPACVRACVQPTVIWSRSDVWCSRMTHRCSRCSDTSSLSILASTIRVHLFIQNAQLTQDLRWAALPAFCTSTPRPLGARRPITTRTVARAEI